MIEEAQCHVYEAEAQCRYKQFGDVENRMIRMLYRSKHLSLEASLMR